MPYRINHCRAANSANNWYNKAVYDIMYFANMNTTIILLISGPNINKMCLLVAEANGNYDFSCISFFQSSTRQQSYLNSSKNKIKGLITFFFFFMSATSITLFYVLG